jgi:hypothetical protein
LPCSSLKTRAFLNAKPPLPNPQPLARCREKALAFAFSLPAEIERNLIAIRQ